MPVEIRELIIKATVSDEKSRETRSTAISAEQKEILISECVEAVLQVLKEKQER